MRSRNNYERPELIFWVLNVESNFLQSGGYNNPIVEDDDQPIIQ